jgi:hypothetical protein
MSLTQEAQTRAKDIRARLRRPPNAVIDIGIDLHRIPPGMRYADKKRTLPKPVLEYHKEPVQLLLPLPTTKVAVSFRSILDVVAAYFGLGIKDLRGPCRKRIYANPRHIAIYLGNIHTDLTYHSIGLQLYRDHTSVMYADHKMRELVVRDHKMAELIRILEERLLNE